MTPTDAAVVGASFVLQHVPDLVRYGSKPRREPEQLAALRRRAPHLRRRRRLSAEPGRSSGTSGPRHLWTRPRAVVAAPGRRGPRRGVRSARSMDRPRSTSCSPSVDQFELMRLRAEPGPGELAPVPRTTRSSGAFARRPRRTTSRSRRDVLLENLAVQGQRRARARATCWRRTGVDPASIPYAIGCGRGGGRRPVPARRWQRREGDRRGMRASPTRAACDVKSFCAAPDPRARASRPRWSRPGSRTGSSWSPVGRSAKLGMKFEGALRAGLAHPRGRARRGWRSWSERAEGADGPIDPDGRGRPHAGRGRRRRRRRSSEALVGAPLDALGITIADVGTYATEIHNPEITEPQGGGDVPDRNYQMLAGLGGGARRARPRTTSSGSRASHGLPGFSPTQGHIASARCRGCRTPCARCERGDLHRRC